MTKLKYPSNGIYSVVNVESNDCLTHLNNALANTDYSVPNNFSYKSYMKELKSTLKDFSKEMNKIITKLSNTTTTFEETELDMIAKAKTIKGYKVIERDRMIY